MNHWLANESKWAREQALKCERAAEDLRDGRKLASARAKTEADIARLRWRFRSEMRMALEERRNLSAECVGDLIARREADAERWNSLAVEQSDRLARTEDAALFEETP